MPGTPSAAGFENTRVRLASGLTLAEELLLVSLRPAGIGSARGRIVARASVARGMVLLALVDLMLLGRIRRADTSVVTDETTFGDAGTVLDGGPLAEIQRELTGVETPRGWLKKHREGIGVIVAQTLADRGLAVLDARARPALTSEGAALGLELRAGYREILRGELPAPPAEALWLIAVERASVSSAVFRDGCERAAFRGGFRQDEPLWFNATEAGPELHDLFAALRFVRSLESIDSGL